MVWFIFAIILGVAAVICGLLSLAKFDDEFPNAKLGFRISAGVTLALAVLLFALSGMREVPTRAVGVPTAFGRVESTLRPGIHWKAPWTTVNILDETIQTTTFEGCQGQFCTGTSPVRGDCLEVRIGGQQTACLDVTIQWRILDSGAPGLFNDYNGQGTSIMNAITDAVVVRELKQVTNEVLGDYNPIQDVSLNATAGNSQFSTFGPKVLAQMRSDLKGRITVVNVLMPLLRYDSDTQSRLNQIQQQFGETAIAQQEVQTNQAQAKANSAIASSVSTNPAVLQYECLQITQDAIKAGYTGLPANWSCTGSGSQLAVNAGK